MLHRRSPRHACHPLPACAAPAGAILLLSFTALLLLAPAAGTFDSSLTARLPTAPRQSRLQRWGGPSPAAAREGGVERACLCLVYSTCQVQRAHTHRLLPAGRSHAATHPPRPPDSAPPPAGAPQPGGAAAPRARARAAPRPRQQGQGRRASAPRPIQAGGEGSCCAIPAAERLGARSCCTAAEGGSLALVVPPHQQQACCRPCLSSSPTRHAPAAWGAAYDLRAGQALSAPSTPTQRPASAFPPSLPALQGERVWTAMRYDMRGSTEVRSRLRLRSTVPGATPRLDIQAGLGGAASACNRGPGRGRRHCLQSRPRTGRLCCMDCWPLTAAPSSAAATHHLSSSAGCVCPVHAPKRCAPPLRPSATAQAIVSWDREDRQELPLLSECLGRACRGGTNAGQPWPLPRDHQPAAPARRALRATSRPIGRRGRTFRR